VSCLLDNKEALTEVLTYHALTSVSPSTSFDGTAEYDTVQGGKVTVTANSSGVTINEDSKVVQADILAFNGISHGIDEVLIPPGFTCPAFESLEVVASDTLYDAIESDPHFATLTDMVQAAGLEDTLRDESKHFTVFAPTNAAFAAIDDTKFSCLLDNPTVLSTLLLYHILPEVEDANDLRIVKIFKTVEGSSLLVNGLTATNGSIQVNDAEVTKEDIEASNGIIHALDGVIAFPGFSCP